MPTTKNGGTPDETGTTDIRYARSKDLNIAYQILGKGEKTVFLINGWVSNLEEGWHLPGVTEWLTELAGFSRLVLFDKRGVGLSDRVSERNLPGLDERMEDLRAIMDREGIEKATLLGFSEGGPMAILFSAVFPERVESLILYGSYACWTRQPDYPIGLPLSVHEKTLKEIERNWGKPLGLPLMAPSVADDPVYRNAWASMLRKSAGPQAALLLYRMNLGIDVRQTLPSLQVPVLIIHRSGDRLIPLPLGRYLADHIPGARFELLDGIDHLPWLGRSEAVLRLIREFLGSPGSAPPTGSFLATVLAFRPVGQNQSPDFIELISHQGGEAFRRSEDTVVGIFAGPEKAYRCLLAIQETGPAPDTLRMAVHTGVCRREDRRPEGPAVDLAAGLLDSMEAGQAWVTKAARNLLSPLLFRLEPVREVSLPGQPVPIRVYARPVTAGKDRSYQEILREGKLREEDIATLLEIRNYLEANYLADLTLESIGRSFGLNGFKLKYGFRKLFDTPVKQFIQDLRLEHAYQLVAHTSLPITDIADQTGYRQAGNFTKAFGRKYGRSPVEVRRGVQG
ncbi:alpha/beta fold hydrolase [Larkinella soli]|uniref:alpha/beta fold hydrolase n=1 Tax=Larkinella soli TaxID=1770527 RepID=UPI000FFBF95D|nr:alpha/beta fold hydrolase [Larkinella soli]